MVDLDMLLQTVRIRENPLAAIDIARNSYSLMDSLDMFLPPKSGGECFLAVGVVTSMANRLMVSDCVIPQA